MICIPSLLFYLGATVLLLEFIKDVLRVIVKICNWFELKYWRFFLEDE